MLLSLLLLSLPTCTPASRPAGLSRRVLLSSATAVLVQRPLCAGAATRDNLAEEKLAAILVKKVKEREEQLGFKLDADDIREVENILRNKY